MTPIRKGLFRSKGSSVNFQLMEANRAHPPHRQIDKLCTPTNVNKVTFRYPTLWVTRIRPPFVNQAKWHTSCIILPCAQNRPRITEC